MKYFWFSGEQYRVKMFGCGSLKKYSNQVKTDSGWREFTEQTEEPNPSGLWKDYALVYKSNNPEVRYS